MANSIAKNFRFFSLLRFAFPTMIMMLFMSLYTIVDGIFISRLVGSHALSSTNIVYPVINLIIACGVMLSTGGSALVAKKLGEGRESEAREDFSALLITGILAGVGLMVVGLVFLEPLVRLLGATDLLLDDSMTYLRIALFFAPACILQLFFQTFFVTAGKPGYGLALICAGGVFNIVFDYIFMGPLEMGIAGADFIHDAFPVMLDDGQIFFWESEQDRFVDSVLTLGNIVPVFIGHEQHRFTFMPEGAGSKSFIILGHVIDDIADQTLLCTDVPGFMNIRRDLEFYTCLRKVGLSFRVGSIAKPAFFDNCTNCTFSGLSFIGIPITSVALCKIAALVV